ncbi:specificity subunit S of type I restriction-modification system, partial [Helicobacter pylori]
PHPTPRNPTRDR